ncbi:Zinc-binding domain, partial [Trinorchestia longiramus]
GFLSFRDMAKVRFSCQFCLRGWTSMFGVILFFYCWNPVEKRGLVRFLLMGQSCNNCMKKNVFETPMWYPEEAEKVMTNLFYDVSSRVFGKVVPPFNYDRRYGRPRHHHNAQQCQGCSLHLCKP